MPLRKYEPVWMDLKKKKSCIVQVHRLIAPRVVKAVIKEKNMDVAFKMANDKDRLSLKIRRIELADKKHIRIEFRLVQRFGLVEIRQAEEIEL